MYFVINFGDTLHYTNPRIRRTQILVAPKQSYRGVNNILPLSASQFKLFLELFEAE